MYTQIFFVTSVRGMVLPPQMAAKASLSFFGAKMPTLFFLASAFFLPAAFFAILPAAFFVALSAALVAFVTVVFVVLTVTLVVVVMVIEGCKCTDA